MSPTRRRRRPSPSMTPRPRSRPSPRRAPTTASRQNRSDSGPAMKDRTILRTGVVGSVVAAVCCFTPVLVILLGAVGLYAWLGWFAYVMLIGRASCRERVGRYVLIQVVSGSFTKQNSE